MMSKTVTGERKQHGLFVALIAAIAAATMGAATPQAHAQGVARVAAAQRVTERKAGAAGAYQRAGAGTVLAVGDSFRTGKRSKADIKFTDGSLLRLGQLSSVEMRSAKGVRLVGGQLLFAALRPGRVLAGTAAAEIKGSVVIVRLSSAGVATITMYGGAVDVVTPRGRFGLSPGQEVDVAPDGVLSLPRPAAALQYAQGELNPELATAPVNSPFSGSEGHRATLLDPNRIALDQNVQLNKLTSVEEQAFVFESSPLHSPGSGPPPNFGDFVFAPPPGAPPAGIFGGTVGNGTFTATFVDPVSGQSVATTGPYGDPDAAGTFGGTYSPGQYDITLDDTNSGLSTLSTRRNPDSSVNFIFRDSNGTSTGTIPAGEAPPGLPFGQRSFASSFAPLFSMSIPLSRKMGLYLPVRRNLGLVLSRQFGGPKGDSGAAKNSARPGGWLAMQGLNMTPTAGAAASATGDATTTDTARAIEAAEEAVKGPPSDLKLDAAYKHLEQFQAGRGRSLEGEAALIGAISDGGTRVVGARLRGLASSGRFFAELALRPLRLYDDGASTDFSAVSDANLTYRDRRGDIQIGRQRFLRGPTQITLFGSLVRQGSREVMDAVRISPNIGQGRKLELAYLYDAFPRNLPFRIGGAQKGFYGRFSVEERFGNFGLNLLRYTDAPVDSTLGASLDFSVPIARDEIELYGEVGRDMFRRRLTTLGLSFPGLFERTDFDLYLEYARLRDSRVAPGPPNELSARVYRRINRHINMVLSLSRFSGSRFGGNDTNLTLGLSIGARSSGLPRASQ